MRKALIVLAALPIALAGACSLNLVELLFAREGLQSREYTFIEKHLDAPFRGYDSLDTLAPQFRVIALSQMAMGMMSLLTEDPSSRERVLPRVEEIAVRALSANVSPFGRPFGIDEPLDDHNLYFSHVALILGIERYARCGAGCARSGTHDELLTRLVTHLRGRTLATRTFHARSYPNSPRWPADQLVTLVALRVYDATHGTRLLEAPLRGYLEVMRAYTDVATGLHQSAITNLPYSRVPRGCALSYSIPLLAQVAPDVARDQYVAYQRHMRASVLGLGGFREWPEGRGLGVDVDSGPVVFGMGVAATGFGLAAARIMHDEAQYNAIRRTVMTFGGPGLGPSGGHLTAPLLGEAILLNGRTARVWFPDNRAVSHLP